MELNKDSWTAQLKFYTLSLYRQCKIGHHPDTIPSAKPIVREVLAYSMAEMPEMTFEDHSAVFRFDNGTHLLVHWPLKDCGIDKEAFLRFCYDQTTALQAQLYVAKKERTLINPPRLISFDITTRRLIHFDQMGQRLDEPTGDSQSEYVYDTSRYTAPKSIFETILEGGTPGSYGMRVK